MSDTVEDVIEEGPPPEPPPPPPPHRLVNGVVVLLTEEEIAERAAEEMAEAAKPSPVPAAISRRQMLLALSAGEVITAEEALAAAMTGAVPAAIDAVFAGLSTDDALAARITFATMIEVERAHPLIGAMIAAELVTAEQADDLFRLAAKL
jgi:hypothetical protein